jgi:diguanylate cyclase (GGDEF)-like protein
VHGRSAWKKVGFIGFCAVLLYFRLPGDGGKDAGYSVIGLASVACVLVGVKRRGPVDRLAWFAIAIGNLAFVLGDGVYGLYEFVLHRSTPFPSVADAFYLGGYPFLIVGVARLTRRPGDDGFAREKYADAGIVSLGALALSWHFLMASYAHDVTLGVFGRFVTMGYPVLDLGVLFIVVQGLIFGIKRPAAHKFIAAAMFSMIVADFVYDLLTLRGTYKVGNQVDAGWLIAYVLVAVAALHPDVPAPATVAGGDNGSRRRLPAVALAGFVPPMILLISSLAGNNRDVPALALTSILLFGLVVLRMRWMFDRVVSQTRSLEQSLSARDSLENELRYQAFHDGLTGLANRALLRDRVEHALFSAKRTGHLVAVCFCDLDGFKAVNDSLGHSVGDGVLIAAGERLVGIVRPGDTVARLGGDEFAVVMDNVEDLASARHVADRIVSALGQSVELEGRVVGMSVSVGVAVAESDVTTEQLLSQADAAMYEAKASGKDRFAVFNDSMHVRLMERLEITTAFEGALERHEFFLQYQPQFSLSDGRLHGFEALIRWQHPTMGLVAPDRFITLAEETGHIVSIGRWVLQAACEQASRWAGRTLQPLTMSVNLSGRQLQDAQIVDDVRAAVALTGVAPQHLTLEITEGMLIVDTERTVQVLAELKKIGVHLSIDDFGTGYSSLSYLRNFPVDELKIDKSFIDTLLEPNGEGRAFVESIVSLAHSLGLIAVAEGVEYADQQEILADLGCDGVQGYYLSRPLDALAASELVVVYAGDYRGDDLLARQGLEP